MLLQSKGRYDETFAGEDGFCWLLIFVYTCMLSVSAVRWLKECIAGMT